MADETLSELQLDVLLRQALEAITRMLNADAASLLIANDTRTELISRAGFGLGQEVDLALSIPTGAGAAGPILATGEPRIIDDLTRVQVVSSVLRASGHRSFVGVPLSSSGRTFGVLHATAKRASAFGHDDVDLLMRFAEPIAAAIDRVELFEAERAARQIAERATERVRGLQRTTSALVTAVTVNEICQIIIQEALPGSVEGGEGAIWMLRDSRLLLVAGFGASAEYPEIPLNPSLPAAGILREEYRCSSRRWPRSRGDGPSSRPARRYRLPLCRSLPTAADSVSWPSAFTKNTASHPMSASTSRRLRSRRRRPSRKRRRATSSKKHDGRPRCVGSSWTSSPTRARV